MPRKRPFLVLGAIGLLGLGGCVAYPGEPVYGVGPVYVAPAPVYAAPPIVYFGGGYDGYRQKHGRPWGYGGGWGHRGWR